MELGWKSVFEMMENMTLREYSMWVDYYSDHLFTEDREYWNMTTIAEMYFNSHIDQKKTKPRKRSEFMPDFTAAKEEKKVNEVIKEVPLSVLRTKMFALLGISKGIQREKDKKK